AISPCGPNGYALHFGLPNCQAFVKNEELFTPKGKDFLDCVRPSLADFVKTNIIGQNVTNCTAITNL
ncbi:hypothetical protein PENTCL1PPCAC_15259, partial [Pristionchus entomophagus]